MIYKPKRNCVESHTLSIITYKHTSLFSCFAKMRQMFITSTDLNTLVQLSD